MRWAMAPIPSLNPTDAVQIDVRKDARAGQMHLISNDDDWNEFFRAEQVRASLTGRNQ